MSSAISHVSTEIRDRVSPQLIDFAVEKLGAHAVPLFDELTIALQEGAIAPPAPREIATIGDTRYGILEYNGQFYRSDTSLSYTVIEDMLANGAIQFALAIKQSSIHSVLRNDRSWQAECEDERIKNIVYGMARQIFRDYASEMLLYMPYGAMFFEKQWTKLEPVAKWGIEGSRGKAYGYEKLASVNPETIAYINYDGKKFDGFTQLTHKGEVHVPAEYSLVLSYDKKFRNLWGSSILSPAYPYWFWLEISTRAFMRYLERTGTPVTIVYAPGRQKVRVGGVAYDSMDYALLQAAYIAKSNAAAFPSDVHEEGGHKLWEVEYLEPSQRGDSFIRAIEYMNTMIMRSMIIADRTATAGDGTGSYAMSQTHLGVSQLHNQLVLDDFVSQINRYVVGPIVQYNGRRSTPPAAIVVEGLDEGARGRLFQLISIAGNQAGDAQPLGKVDWERLYELTGIPALTQEEVDAIAEDKLKKDVHKQEVFAKAQAKMAQQNPQNPGFQQKQTTGQAEKEKNDRIKQSAEFGRFRLEQELGQGKVIPFLLSDTQADGWFDRLSRRGKVFVFENKEPSLDEIVEQILQESLAGEVEIPSEEEIEEARQAIRDYLTGDLQELEEIPEGYIELSVGSFLKRAWGKIKRVANKVVKAVTGRSITEWRERKATAKEAEKRIGQVQIVTKDGRVWRPEEHPRDESGRFAKRATSGLTPGIDRERYDKTPPRERVDPGLMPRRDRTGNQPGGAKTEEELDAVLKHEGFNLYISENASEFTRMTTKGLLHDAAMSDSPVANCTRNVIVIDDRDELIKFADEIREEHPKIAESAMYAAENFGGGLYFNGADCMIVTGPSDHARGWFETAVIHELTHSINYDKEPSERKQGGISFGGVEFAIRYTAGANGRFVTGEHYLPEIEEPTTDLLAKRFLQDHYGYGLSSAANGDEYDRMALAMSKFLYEKNDGDVEAVWADIENIHKMGGSRGQLLSFIQDTYPDLTTSQVRQIRKSVGSWPTWTEDGSIFLLAMRYHAQNVRASDRYMETLSARQEDIFRFLLPSGAKPLYTIPRDEPRYHSPIHTRTRRFESESSGKSLVLENGSEPDLDEIVEQILAEILTDEGEQPTEEEIEEARQAIRSYLLGPQKLEDVPSGYIELSVGGFLKRAMNKVRSVANRVVKRVTGRNLSEWRQKRKDGDGGASDVVVTVDGRVWKEEDHPRDASGRFASGSGSAAESELSKPETAQGLLREDAGPVKESLRSVLGDEPWPGADPSLGIKAKLEINGQSYELVGDVSFEQIQKVHDMTEKFRGQSLDSPHPVHPVPVLLIGASEQGYEDLGLYFNKVLGSQLSPEEIVTFLEESPPQQFAWHENGRVTLDTALLNEHPDIFEETLFHETMHGQRRETGQDASYLDTFAEEICTTLLTMEYGEKNDIAVINGYPQWVSWAAQMAQENGWSKQQLYDFARDLHYKDGDEYKDVLRAAMDTAETTRDMKMNFFEIDERKYPEALDKYWPDWEDAFTAIADTYQLDRQELLDSIWG